MNFSRKMKRYSQLGGRCPPNPLGFFALAKKSRKHVQRTPGPGFFRTARRSGCVPAEPYPPNGTSTLITLALKTSI